MQMPWKALPPYVRGVSPVALVLLALLAVPAAGAEVGQYQAYPLQHKRAADVEAQLRALLGHLDPPPRIVADPRGNQLLVSGPPAAHQIAHQFLQSVDRPVEPRPAAAAVQGYRVPPQRLTELALRIEARLGNRPDVRLTTDQATSQIIVLAPPDVQALIAREVTGPEVPAEAQPPAPLPPALARTQQSVTLTHLTAAQLESRLRELLGIRLRPRAASQPHEHIFAYASGPRSADVLIDTRSGLIRFAGDERVVAQLARLVKALEAPPESGTAAVTTRVLPTQKVDPARLREAIDAYRRGQRESSPADGAPRNQNSQHARPVRLPFVLAQHTEAVPADDRSPAGKDRPADEQEPRAAPRPGERLRALGTDVEIETLPDLDVIILRGRDRDVEEVRRIIAELERISAETIPTIDIYQLRHVNCQSLVVVLDLAARDLVGGRQGKIHITPLVKPNALLLIGWGETVVAVKELIAKLDQPVAADTQLRAYRLTHAPVARAAAILLETFRGQTGLGARVEVIPEPRTNTLIVRAAPRDLAEVDLLIQRIDQGTTGIVSQARLFKLKNTLAGDLAATLQNAILAATGKAGGERSTALELLTADVAGQKLVRSGVLSDVQVTPDVHTNTLVVTGPAESMGLLAALIEQLDQPTGTAQIKVFRIVNGDANSLALTLRTLLPAQAMTAGPQLAATTGETTLVPLRFSVDSRTNSIIATGPAGDLALVEALLLRLDETDVQQRVNTVYRLKNAPALDVAQAVNEFLRTERKVQQAAPGVINPFEQIEREVIVVPEPVSNSLIISATQRFTKEIMTLIEKLDEQPPQVMIQVVIAEVALGNINEFGVELGLQDSVLFDRSVVTNLLGTPPVSSTLTPGYNFNNQPLGNNGVPASSSHIVGGQGLSHFSLGRVNSDLNYGGLVLSASSESVSVLLRALKQSRRIEVLGRPQIMTLDNQPAMIQVGEKVPRVVGSSITTIGQQNSITMENTGLILGVTPRISPEGMVVMEIDAEKSKVGDEAEGIPISVNQGQTIRSPKISITSAQTTVSAASGETIALGGLITRDSAVTRRGVPLLSDIPLLGRLFRYDSDVTLRTELLIFLTPHVIRSNADLERIKRTEAARMHWTLSDVNAIHGPLGIPQEALLGHWPVAAEVIYPDRNPIGAPPREAAPGQPRPPDLAPPGRLPAPAEAIPQATPGNRMLFEEEVPAAPSRHRSSNLRPLSPPRETP
jgi:type II secretion system protein D